MSGARKCTPYDNSFVKLPKSFIAVRTIKMIVAFELVIPATSSARKLFSLFLLSQLTLSSDSFTCFWFSCMIGYVLHNQRKNTLV